MSEREECCGTCRYFRPYDESDEDGLCRRYPRQVIVISMRSYDTLDGDRGAEFETDSHHPEEAATSWCGEYQPRKEEQG